jgi:DNA polymerase-1
MPSENEPVASDVGKPVTDGGLLLLFDGHAYAYRAHFAIKRLSSPSGEPTNAIYGFIKMLAKASARLVPTHAAVVWDGGLAVERMELLPAYKAQRAPMPDDLDKQMGGMVEYLAASRIASIEQAGVEADDLIGVLARRGEAAGMQVVVASSDKDFMQLVGPRVGLLNPNDKSESVWTDQDVRNKSGVEPAQIVDWLSLMGDAVDNIPGVRGVGGKTAAALLQQFGSVDALYQRLDEVKSERLRTNLRLHEPDVRRNQRLTRLNDQLPCELGWPELSVKKALSERLRPLYEHWGFRSLAQELPMISPAQTELF